MTSSTSGPGDYPDRDLPEGDVEVGEGTYTDQETPQEKRGEEPDLRGPGDRGEYTDADHVEEHRPPPTQGGYTSKDNAPGNQAAGNQTTGENSHG